METYDEVRSWLSQQSTHFLIYNTELYKLDRSTKWHKLAGGGNWYLWWSIYQLGPDREMMLNTLATFIVDRLPEATPLVFISIA